MWQGMFFQWLYLTPDLINFAQLLFYDFIYMESKSPTTSNAIMRPSGQPGTVKHADEALSSFIFDIEHCFWEQIL